MMRTDAQNPLIALVSAHPECDWSLRPPTDEERESSGTNTIEMVLGFGGADIYATVDETIEFLNWLGS